jgi:23S rRNA (cytidine2498-2'-O)-methyltransferase
VSACLGADGAVALGVVTIRDAVSRFPGGRARMRVDAERPSRAARKVEEALAWMGVAPGAGEVCVDLGAAPGGWSWALLDRRARVIAVDPAELRPDIARHRGLRHEKKSAFGYEPDEPVDWLFCDMAWRPLEAAQLLAKWGRRRWARMLVANLKLPMKKKAAMVEELRAIVHGGGWRRVRTRQLYHDRDEITLTAVR